MRKKTTRILLRNIEQKDLNDFYRYHNSTFVLNYNCMEPMNEKEIKTYIQKHQQNDHVLVIANHEDHFIGMIFLNPDSLRFGVNSVEISYWLGEDYKGQGYMSEALNIVLHDLFIEKQVNSVTARAFSDNTKSVLLLKKLGFAHEGTLKHAVLGYGNVVHDDCLFSLDRKTWFMLDNGK